MPSDPSHVVLQYALEWFIASHHNSAASMYHVVHLHWIAPNPETCKINFDGGRKSKAGLIRASGLLRYSNGHWLKGFVINLGIGSILEAELLGIFWGLTLAWDASFRFVEVESDANSVVSFLNIHVVPTHPLFSLVNCCKLIFELIGSALLSMCFLLMLVVARPRQVVA
ncbi:hypothetical protein L3X38_041057 [Prunus dulcis]|uniref:RNase H type-1 domain-containing protein n=1 Tax=Prunus dulcis TaxID=3755 RepID=A0AAD4UTM6_PRUDU|nr:hypothetical protein L3X38_041057 [Prunus dulcis]